MRHPITPQDNAQHGLLRAHRSLRGSQRAHPGRFVRTLRHCAAERRGQPHRLCPARPRMRAPLWQPTRDCRGRRRRRYPGRSRRATDHPLRPRRLRFVDRAGPFFDVSGFSCCQLGGPLAPALPHTRAGSAEPRAARSAPRADAAVARVTRATARRASCAERGGAGRPALATRTLLPAIEPRFGRKPRRVLKRPSSAPTPPSAPTSVYFVVYLRFLKV
jgi:hypothetical protein